MPHEKKQMASFFLTSDCNLHCVYCYNHEKREREGIEELSFEMAKAGVDYFYKTNSSRHIRFYGPGEPTKAFKVMKQIVDYAKEKDDRTTVEIQTNGCFSKSVRDWIKNNINIVWVSFDGYPEIQDRNRPLINGKPSSPIIEENVKCLISSNSDNDIMVGARVTITDETIFKQSEIIRYFHSLGIDNVWSDPIFPSVEDVPVCDDPKRKEQFHFDMINYVDQFIEAREYAISLGMIYGSFLTCNFDGKCIGHCRACTPVPHFTTDGYISACDLVTFGRTANHMNCFIYGKWDEETKSYFIDEEKVRIIQSRVPANMPHCRECSVKEHCGGYCLGEVANETGTMFGQKRLACMGIQRLFKKLGELPPYPYLHP